MGDLQVFRGFASLLSQVTQIFFALFGNECHLLSSPSSRASYNHKGHSQIINSHLAVTSTSSFSAFVCQQPVWLVWKVALKRDLGSLIFCWCQVVAGHAHKHQNCPYLLVCPYYKLATNQFRASLSGCIHLNSSLLEPPFTRKPIYLN